VVAANLDVIFLITSANDEFNPRRIERYLSAVIGGGAQPVVVVNKIDLSDEPDRFLAQARGLMPGLEVFGTSALDGRGVAAFDPWLEQRLTLGFVGSSGVGKSSLLNRIAGEEVQATLVLRRDDTGRHTTTHRELFAVPGRQALIVDTPGMREFGIWATAGVSAVFGDVEGLLGRCRFRDCRHETEPGCALLDAIDAGELTASRLKAWRKLQRELHHLESRTHEAVDWRERRRRRRFARKVRRVQEEKRRMR